MRREVKRTVANCCSAGVISGGSRSFRSDCDNANLAVDAKGQKATNISSLQKKDFTDGGHASRS
jgi:hypothetical protein